MRGKKVLCVFLAVSLAMGIGVNNLSSMGIDKVNANQRPTKEVIMDVKVYTDEYVPLLDTNNSEMARYYETTNGGYVIVDNSGEVVEFDDDTPVEAVTKNKDLYYLGPTQIFEKKNDTLVSLQDSSYEVAFGEVQENYVNFIAEAKKEQDDYLTASIDENGNEETGATIEPGLWVDLKGGRGNTLVKNTDCLDTNMKDNCGSTAAAIMLLYYDKYVSNKYVDNKYRKEKNWMAFTKKLIKYIEPNGGGSTMYDVQKGINKYLKSRKLRQSCLNAEKGDWYKEPKEILIDKIDANRPIMLDLDNHPYFSEHWVVAEGYFIKTSGKKHTYACINDGWGNNRSSQGKRMYVNMSYVGRCVYLN